MENDKVLYIEATALSVGNRGANVMMKIESSGNVAHQIEVCAKDAEQLSEALARVVAKIKAKAAV